MWKILSFCLFFLFIAGCRFLQISDEQIEEIAKEAGTVAAAAGTVGGDAITPGAGAGVGAIAGLIVAALSKTVLNLIKKTDTTK